MALGSSVKTHRREVGLDARAMKTVLRESIADAKARRCGGAFRKLTMGLLLSGSYGANVRASNAKPGRARFNASPGSMTLIYRAETAFARACMRTRR